MRRLTLKEFDVFANDPEMLREQGGSGAPFDNAWFFAHPGNVALEHDGCCIPARQTYMHWDKFPGGVCTGFEYDIHFLFPPATRGKRALDAARAMVQELFTSCMALRITGTIPRTNLAARMVIRQLGFAPVGTCELAGQPAITYELSKSQCLGSTPHSPSEPL